MTHKIKMHGKSDLTYLRDYLFKSLILNILSALKSNRFISSNAFLSFFNYIEQSMFHLLKINIYVYECDLVFIYFLILY